MHKERGIVNRHHTLQLACLLAAGVGILAIVFVSRDLASASSHLPGEVRESITATTTSQRPGVFGWLESLLPDGIRFTGIAAGPNDHREILATAACFDSGAGVSCNGFSSLEEYVAAVRVSEDLGVPIQKLKARIQKGKSLPQAVAELRPGDRGQIVVLRAEQQAKTILKRFSS
jgi:hypothetical protein